MIIKVGSEVDAWCTKCRMDLGHRVVAVLEARPKRVECLTCHSQHNYRKAKGGAAAGATSGSPASGGAASKPAAKSKSKAKPAAPKARRLSKGEATLLQQWEARVAGKGRGDFVKYAVSGKFQSDQLIEHSKFGQGFVSEVHQDNKISVVFHDGERILAHARD